MNISRRSFLKLAALSTAAVAVSASMTGCSTPWNPTITIVYQEKKTGESYAFTGNVGNLLADGEHKIWTDGKKQASSSNKFIFNAVKDLQSQLDEEQAAKDILAELAKDYNVTGKTVKVDVNSAKSENKGATSYTITIPFTVETSDKSGS